MGFEIKNSSDSRVFEQHISEEELAKEAFREESFSIPMPNGTLEARQWMFDGIKMSYSSARFHEPVVWDWKGDTEVITMHFNLQGKVSMLDSNLPRAFELRSNQHNIFYGREAEGKMKVDDLRMKSFLIQLSRKSFFAIASDGNDSIKRFADAVALGKSVAFSNSNLSIDLPIQNCINAVLHCKYADSLKRMYFLSKSIELLVLQAESFDKANSKKLYVTKDYDKERLLFARDYLLQHIEQPPTLSELAVVAGINEYKLKKGFKEIFGQTVFGYLSEVRLDMARTDLIEKRKSVTDIAFDLGYSSLQHFSAAFKKKFGVPPKRVG